MPVPDNETETCEAIENPEVYKIYTKWMVIKSLISMLFCIAFVAGITAVTILTEWKWMAWLYILPTACYIAAEGT